MNFTPRFKSWVVVVILGVISSAMWDAIKAATAIPHYISFHLSFLRVIDVVYSIALASVAFILGSRRANDALTLPALRPKIVPVRWGRTPDNRCGLFIRNDGEPAFDISISEPVLIGKAKLQFWNRVHSGLTRADGEMLAEAHIELATGYGLTADGLREQMLKADLGTVSLKISYGDVEGRRWTTVCDLVNEFWGTGIRVSNLRQAPVK